MPNPRNPNSLQSRVEAWLRDNPGAWRCAEIRDGLGMAGSDDTHKVAAACYQLLLAQRAMRGIRPTTSGRGRPFTTYAATPVPAEATT